MLLNEVVQRVSVENDAWIYVTDICVAISAGLAAYAIWYTGHWARRTERSAEKAAENATRVSAFERRMDFELGLLAGMSQQYNTTFDARHVTGYVQALIRDPADETELLSLREATGVQTNAATKAADDAAILASPPAAIQAEISAAIQRRLDLLP
jgi:hypothetical protein